MAERTMKEQREAVLQELQKYLPVPSPYAVWGAPGEISLSISKRDNEFKSASDIELAVMRGNFARSDYFYLLAASCYQFGTFPAICALIKFWKKKDIKDATAEGRDTLIIPNADESHLNRIRSLCRKGVLNRYDFRVDPQYPLVGNDSAEPCWQDFYRANSYGVGICTTALERKLVSFDFRTVVFPEHEMLRWAQNSILTGAFLQLPSIADVKFLYKVKVNKFSSVQLMSYLSVTNEKRPELNCNMILETCMLKTNEVVVTAKARKEAFESRICELLKAMRYLEETKERPQILVVCLEDILAVKALLEVLSKHAGASFANKILLTTGTILDAKQVVEPGFSHQMRTSFLEYDGSSFTGVAPYYFFF